MPLNRNKEGGFERSYDANLTEKFVEYIGDWSPIDPIQVN
jgi:hypothetical protein